MSALRFAPLVLVFVSFSTSCTAYYKEPATGNEATLNCIKAEGPRWTPVPAIRRIDGTEVERDFWAAKRSIKLSPGAHRIDPSASTGASGSITSLVVDFAPGRTYTIETIQESLMHLYKIKDSSGKLVATSQAPVKAHAAPIMMMPIVQ